ncbi:TetR/AcrR family transcriptional regulator [Companilactobacillus bobalius]|uniref:HTH tetR-type domain-containing protein n=1 Tax=Companilactobacillus bobalius TaxID=2801451 RepID=A0A202FFB1_9LACO|nr:TetR/AcrR family transcriptional regulator [Companilactobacillus bobalius]KAE9560384.1 hypothetical protein ATN92_09465 [Companilactobacillus bobalius]OVE99179.1 hypothetical protein LKACC16343_00291 [Companilactobacillus bobalius]GEO57155.1 TetR family transcriptional regulator [Companilactobacillus paralimentarius]
MTNRQVAAEATRKKLIATADKLIRTKGYEKMSVEDITKASGVAKGTFYNYFKKKEDITLALSQNHLSSLNNLIPELGGLEPEDAIRKYLINYLQIVVKSGDKMARQWIRYIVDPKNYKKWEFDLDSLQQLLEKLSAEQKLSNKTPINDLAKLLMTEVYGIVLSWCISPNTVDPVKDIKTFCDLQLTALMNEYLN